MSLVNFELELIQKLMQMIDVPFCWALGGFVCFLEGNAVDFEGIDLIFPKFVDNDDLYDYLIDHDLEIAINKFGGFRFAMDGEIFDVWTLADMGLKSDANEEQIKNALPLKKNQQFNIRKIERK